MSSRNSSTLTLDVRTRRAEQRAVWLTLVAAACAVVLVGAMAIVAVGAIAWGFWRAGWIGSRYRIVTVRWLADGRWTLTDIAGITVPGELSADTRRLPRAVWLRWKTGPVGRRSMLLTAEDLPAGQLRALAVRLKIEAPTRATKRALPEAGAR
jgi:hypothetical protein